MPITEENVKSRLKEVMHPAISLSLVDLGIVSEVCVEDDLITITMAFPMPDIPIGDYLINSVKGAVSEFNARVDVNVRTMTEKERNDFLRLEQANWRLP